jgi:hypothetical protein
MATEHLNQDSQNTCYCFASWGPTKQKSRPLPLDQFVQSLHCRWGFGFDVEFTDHVYTQPVRVITQRHRWSSQFTNHHSTR